ncbi:MAG: HEAT repeat domain-containing protein, partial [Planctomycetota bacterium]
MNIALILCLLLASPPEEDGVRYLLAHQSADGTWGSDKLHLRKNPGPRQATTAIVMMALLDRPGTADAVEKARKALIKAVDDGFIADPTIYLWSWGAVFPLQALAQHHRAHPDDDTARTIRTLIKTLELVQNTDGGWNYETSRYRWKEIRGEELKKSEKSMMKKQGRWNTSGTFMTAPAVLALLEARAAGFDVPEKMVERAVKFLEGSRTDAGTYRYSSYFGADHLAGGSARTVAVELALVLAGSGDRGRLRWALDNFFIFRDYLEHYSNYGAQKARMSTHIGPEGIAPYYYFYGILYASQALHVLDESVPIRIDRNDENTVRTPLQCRAMLRETMMRLRRPEGSWIGSGAGGHHYGTAAALIVLSGRNILGVEAPPGSPARRVPPEEHDIFDLFDKLNATERLSVTEQHSVIRWLKASKEGPDLACALAPQVTDVDARLELIGLAKSDRRFLPAVVPLLKDERYYVFHDALETIRLHGAREHAADVAAVLGDRSDMRRKRALSVLVEFKAVDQVEGIVRLMEDQLEYGGMRIAAARALAKIGGPEYAPQIAALVRRDYDRREGSGAIFEILAGLGEKDLALQFTGPLQDKHGYNGGRLVRVIEGMVRMDAREHADDVAGLLTHKSEEVRGRAAWALARFEARDHTEAIAGLLQDEA